MTLWLISSLSVTITTLLILSSNPLTSGLLILSLALFVATLYASLISPWYALLIFLIYVGGILVIFAYFVALVPNQEKITIKPIIIAFIFLFIITAISKFQTPIHHFTSYSIFNLYSLNNSNILLILALLLLLTIVIIVKIVNLSKGPLRPFFM